MVDKEDTILLRKLAAGDEGAFRVIYDKYHKGLYRLALRYLRHRPRAEDAVHDVFVNLWGNKKNLEPSGSLRGYLFTAAKNHVLNLISRRKRALKRDIQRAYQKKIDRHPPENVIDLSEYRTACREALRQLPERRREVFVLRAEEGLTSREVADYLGISIHTVKSQYWKATEAIRACAHPRGDAETGS